MHKTEVTLIEALNKGFHPERINVGTFETYVLRDDLGLPFAIFKPGLFDIEREIRREFAAYALDYENFAGVPYTIITTLSHPLFGTRKGVCQAFFPGHPVTNEEISFIDHASVRRVAIFDMRFLNIDRHQSNLLVSNSKVIPIDHHLMLPSHFGTCFFSWSNWKAAHTPFSEDEARYVANLNPEKDRAILLEEIGIDLVAANLCFFATTLLKIGVELKLTAHQLSFFFEARHSTKLLDHFKKLLKEVDYKNITEMPDLKEKFTRLIIDNQ